VFPPVGLLYLLFTDEADDSDDELEDKDSIEELAYPLF